MAETVYFIRVQMYGGNVTPSTQYGRPLFPNVFLGFCLDPDIFFDLKNENENELLASVNLKRPVPNSTNCTAIESEISVQVTEKKHRAGK